MRKFYLLQNYEYTVPADPSAADNSPSIAITRCVGSPQFPQQQTDFSCNDNDNKIDGCKDNSVTEHWYSIFNISKRVVCKILDPSLLARQKRSLASIRFNCTPSAICTIDREQSTTTPQAEFFYSMPTHKSYQHLLGLMALTMDRYSFGGHFYRPKYRQERRKARSRARSQLSTVRVCSIMRMQQSTHTPSLRFSSFPIRQHQYYHHHCYQSQWLVVETTLSLFLLPTQMDVSMNLIPAVARRTGHHWYHHHR